MRQGVTSALAPVTAAFVFHELWIIYGSKHLQRPTIGSSHLREGWKDSFIARTAHGSAAQGYNDGLPSQSLHSKNLPLCVHTSHTEVDSLVFPSVFWYHS